MAAPASADPWAHRRGEPRLFAVLWVMYVMASMAGSVHWVYGATQVTADSYSPAARIMLIVIAVGACVLWPMVRLSQVRPRGSVLGAIALDAWVIVVPVLMVVWPMIYMAGWPLEVVLAMSLLMLAWTALISGALANALVVETTMRGLRPRALWMLAILATVLAAPLLGLGLRVVRLRTSDPLRDVVPDWLDMLSPFTGVLAISGRGFSGPQNFVSLRQWEILLAIAVVGLSAWIVAWTRSALSRVSQADVPAPLAIGPEPGDSEGAPSSTSSTQNPTGAQRD